MKLNDYDNVKEFVEDNLEYLIKRLLYKTSKTIILTRKENDMKRESELCSYVKRLISERVYGNVEVYEQLGYLYILIENLHENFSYGYKSSHYTNLHCVIEDCLYGYRIEILKRFIKEIE